MKKSDAVTWSDSWRHPTLTSFGAVFENNYDGPILEFWKTQLRGQFRHVIDLACGNGALTWIANDILNSGQQIASITGVDFAHISPFEALGKDPSDFPGVTFIGDTRLEDLPFEDNSIDLAISQYGVEYADLELAIPELTRVLMPEGKISFMLHDRDGFIVTGATKPIDDYKMLLYEVKAHELMLELGRMHEKFPNEADLTKTSEYRDLMARIEKSSEAFTAVYEKNSDIRPVYVYKSKLNLAFQEASKPPAQRQHNVEAVLKDAQEVFRKNIERMEDLAVCALGENERRRLVELIQKEGFAVTTNQPLEYRPGQVWGTIMVAVGPAHQGGRPGQ